MPLTRITETMRDLPQSQFPDALRQLARLSPAPKEALIARRDEIAVICHELRNSLAVVRGAARLLRAADGRAENNARVLIERHVTQMSRHIEDLLEPQRRSGDDHGLQLSRVDLRSVAQYALDDIGPEVARHRHRVDVKLPAEPMWANADAARLEQVFANLLINAAKYTPDGGDIALVMEREGDRVLVRIRDSGVGIEPAMLLRVFGMFIQVGTSLPGAEKGRGIGLAVVRNVVEKHGGTVTAVSAGLGLGSEFIVVLPGLWAQPGAGIVTP